MASVRHAQYMEFKKVANEAGFGRIRQSDIRSLVTLDLDGAQEAAAGVEWTATYFAGTEAVLGLRTQEPDVRSNQALGNEFMFCARAISLEVQHQATTLSTEAINHEVCNLLSRSVLQIKNGGDVVFERRAGYVLTGDAAIQVGSGILAGGAQPMTKGKLHKMEEGDQLDDPIIMFPGAALSAKLFAVGANTTTIDLLTTLTLIGWCATRGAVEAGSRVLGLSDIVRNPSLAARAIAGR